VSRPLPALPPTPPTSLTNPVDYNPPEERVLFDSGTSRKRRGGLTRKKKLRTRRATKQKNVRGTGSR
jgi:hypothetical protein